MNVGKVAIVTCEDAATEEFGSCMAWTKLSAVGDQPDRRDIQTSKFRMQSTAFSCTVIAELHAGERGCRGG